MRYLRNQVGRTRWGACLLALCAALVFSFVVGAAPEAGHTGLTGLQIDPKAYQTNSLLVNDTSGTAQLTMTAASALRSHGKDSTCLQRLQCLAECCHVSFSPLQGNASPEVEQQWS